MEKRQYVPREFLFPVSQQEGVRIEGWKAFADLLFQYDEYRRTGKISQFLRFCLENGTIEREDGTRSNGIYAYLVTMIVRPVSVGLVQKPDLDRVQARGGRAYEWFALAARAFQLWKEEQKGANDE